MNRGRHRKKPNDGYPPEVNQLLCPEVFKKAFTPEQTRLLLRRQADAGNSSDLTVFEKNYSASKYGGGFNWNETPENWHYWDTMLRTYCNMQRNYLNNRI